MISLIVNKENANKTLCDLLVEKFEHISISKIKRAIKNGDIKLNNKKVLFSTILNINDEIKIYDRDFKIHKVQYDFLKAKKLDHILYEDKNIIVVDKPRGLLCQEDKSEKIDTLNNRIRRYLYESKKWDPKIDIDFIPNLVHRIDKYTTGVIVGAKNKKALVELNLIWNTDAITKQYICLVYGILKNKSKTLKDCIKISDDKKYMEIDKECKYKKEIITHYEVIEEYENASKLLVTIKTGKKHQIRVHLASINHPILGDSKYNKIDTMGYLYPCLNSHKIIFNFPKDHWLNYLNKKEIVSMNLKFK